jgi:hypothetical protein
MQINSLLSPRLVDGRSGIFMIGIIYAILFLLNLLLPLSQVWIFSWPDRMSRLWGETEILIGILSLFILYSRIWFVSARSLKVAIIFAILGGCANGFSTTSAFDGVLTGGIIFFSYLAGVSLLNQIKPQYAICHNQTYRSTLFSGLFGIGVSIPFAGINLLYFFNTQGPALMLDPLWAGFIAINPAVSEEIIFRFFLICLTLFLLREEKSDLVLVLSILILAVVPHSLNHLPDLILENPIAACVLFTASSLLFGLPMAVLQLKKGLFSAITFHWSIDWIRFTFGY